MVNFQHFPQKNLIFHTTSIYQINNNYFYSEKFLIYTQEDIMFLHNLFRYQYNKQSLYPPQTGKIPPNDLIGTLEDEERPIRRTRSDALC